MKRMYVILGLIILLFTWAFSCLGQFSVTQNDPPPEFDRMKRRMELREEMHRRMREKLLQGFGPDQDLFQGMDKLFEDVMSDSFSGSFDQFYTTSSNFESEWSESKEGRTLVITPKSEGQQLDINIEKEMITIKGKTEQKSANTTSVSSFSNAFPVPEDCDSSKVKIDQKNGKIFVYFPYKTDRKSVQRTRPKPALPPKINRPPREDNRVPLPPVKDAVEI